MKVIFLLLFLLFNISFSYFTLKLNKIYLPVLSNDNYTNTKINQTIKEKLDNFEDYNDLPLNNSELNIFNDSYIQTKNINSEQYTVNLYLGSSKQYFRLLLSTTNDFLTVSSINCTKCNVLNKYNPILSKTNKKFNLSNINPNFTYDIYQDFILIPSETIKNDITQNININISTLNFKVIELDSSGFLNSDLIDGILSLNYDNNSVIPNNNFIRELYYEGYISSPSFSIIVTSSNINRLYLGDIMENEYIRNYLDSSMNKGECKIIDNNWKCQLNRIEYNALKSENWASQNLSDHSTVTFNLKDNKLTIPYNLYNLIVVSYKYNLKKHGKSYYSEIKYNKECYTFGGNIYCDCSDKDDFGIVTFHFDSNSTLDIDLRDYVDYDKSSDKFKCKVNVELSQKSEFILGLKGLNNTILSFNMHEKKVKFFHKKKFTYSYGGISIILIIIFILIIFINFISK